MANDTEYGLASYVYTRDLDSSWRSRSAPTSPSASQRGRSTPSCTRCSPRTRSSGSTTSSARRRRRTSSRSASPTACSSRSGTATSSTTCRSTCPRRSASRARRLLRATGAYRDMVVTHLFQVLAFMAMEPPTALEPGRSARRRTRSSARCCRSSRTTSCAASTPATATRRASPRLRHRDVHRAQVRDRQLALGRRAVLPAHRQAAGRGRADHLDRVPRAAQEHVPAGLGRRRARPRPPHLRPRRRSRRCRCRSTASARPGHAARQAEPCSSPCTRPAGSATCSRPTSG
jgi:hypothetical protein